MSSSDEEINPELQQSLLKRLGHFAEEAIGDTGAPNTSTQQDKKTKKKEKRKSKKKTKNSKEEIEFESNNKSTKKTKVKSENKIKSQNSNDKNIENKKASKTKEKTNNKGNDKLEDPLEEADDYESDLDPYADDIEEDEFSNSDDDPFALSSGDESEGEMFVARKLKEEKEKQKIEEERKAKVSAQQKHLDRMKAKLGLTEDDFAKFKKKKEEANKKSAKPSLKLSEIQKKRPPPEVIVFEDPAKRKKSESKITKARNRKQANNDDADDNVFDIKRARHDVKRFGIKGLDNMSKEQATVAMLVKLGAEAPKQQHVNYKKFQVQRKSEIDGERDQREKDRGLGYSVAGKKKKKGRRDINDVGELGGQIGSYKGGMQRISAQEMQQHKNKKNRRR